VWTAVPEEFEHFDLVARMYGLGYLKLKEVDVLLIFLGCARQTQNQKEAQGA
jgi:hypothetical protein